MGDSTVQETTQCLSKDMIQKGLSRLDHAGDGSGYAYVALDLSNQGLTDIEGIQQYRHICFLNLSRNHINELSRLSALEYLVCLDLSENERKELPIFNGNEHLSALDLSKNVLTALTGLQCRSVTSLKVNENQLESLDGIENLPLLTTLAASDNRLSEIFSTPLENPAPPLAYVDLSNNSITSLVGFKNFKQLEVLDIRENKIAVLEDLDTLRHLDKLTELDLRMNPITEIDHYRLEVIIRSPKLLKLDGDPIMEEELLSASQLKQRVMEEMAP